MSDILLTDSLNTTAKFLDTAFEMAVEQDILLADYDQSVFKIVKTNTEHIITQKYINDTKLIIEGYFRISVYYQPPQGGNLTVISKKQPFQKQLDLPSAVNDTHFITVDGWRQYINTRAVNSSRISVSGVYSFAVKVYSTQQIPVITAVNSTSVCTDNRETAVFSLCGRGIRQFSMEDDLSLPQQTDKILNITAHSANMSVMVYQDKVNIKGDMEAEIIYTLTDSADIQHHIQNYAYNQVVDISGISENNAAYADISVISFTVTQNPDTKKIRCILTAQLDVKVFRRESVYTVFDAFSKKYEYNREKKIIVCDENIQSVNKTIRCSVEDTIGAGYTPIHHFVNISAPETTVRKDRNILKAKLTVSAVVKNSTNEYECFTKTGDITIDTGTEINTDDEYILSCCPSQSTAAISDDILKVAASIEATGFVIKRRQLSVLSDFTENTDSPAEAPANALILYYASKGERVFDIAMKYRTDADIIAKENSLDTAKLTEDKMLFIPAFGM